MAPWMDWLWDYLSGRWGYSWGKMWEDVSETWKAEQWLDYQWAEERNRKRDIW